MEIHEMKRREFLRATTGAASLMALAGTAGSFPAFGAQAARSRQELQSLMQEMEEKGRQMLSVPRKDGEFLHLLTKLSRAKRVLEVGTSQGYSAIWIGLALEETGGTLTTIDIAPEKVRVAKANLAKAGLGQRVTCLEGDAHKLLPTLEGPFEFVFLDADKDGQPDYFNKLYPKKLVPGGVIAVHNAIRSANAMKEYFDIINQHPDFDSVILSLTMEDGFSVSYRHRN